MRLIFCQSGSSFNNLHFSHITKLTLGHKGNSFREEQELQKIRLMVDHKGNFVMGHPEQTTLLTIVQQGNFVNNTQPSQ